MSALRTRGARPDQQRQTALAAGLPFLRRILPMMQDLRKSRSGSPLGTLRGACASLAASAAGKG